MTAPALDLDRLTYAGSALSPYRLQRERLEVAHALAHAACVGGLPPEQWRAAMESVPLDHCRHGAGS